MKIQFFEKEHKYLVDGEEFPAVTSVLNILNKPALLPWGIKTTVQYLQERLKFAPEGIFVDDLPLTPENASKVFSRAKQEHLRRKEEAANIGSQVHHLISDEIKRYIKSDKGNWKFDLREADDRVTYAIMAFLQWVAESDFIPLHSEMTVASKTLRYAGTLDCIGEVNGNLSLIDFKTGGFYPEHKMQIAAYREAYYEMTSKRIRSCYVLQLGKEDGSFKVHKIKGVKKHFRAFKNCLALYYWSKEK